MENNSKMLFCYRCKNNTLYREIINDGKYEHIQHHCGHCGDAFTRTHVLYGRNTTQSFVISNIPSKNDIKITDEQLGKIKKILETLDENKEISLANPIQYDLKS